MVKEVGARWSISLGEKLIAFLRRDCEPVLQSQVMWDTLVRLQVADAPATPYNPEASGTVERFARSLSDATRANMFNVAEELWDYAAQFAGDVWDRLPHTYAKLPEHDNKSPIEILDEKVGRKSAKDGTQMLRRFGCLVYFRVQRKKVGKLEEKWMRGVHLGLCPRSGSGLTLRPSVTAPA